MRKINGSDLINNIINEHEKARDLLHLQNSDELSEGVVLANNIKADLIDIMM